MHHAVHVTHAPSEFGDVVLTGEIRLHDVGRGPFGA